MKPKAPAQDLAAAKLASSGLDLADAKRLKIDVIPPDAVAALNFDAAWALQINYLNLHGKPLQDPAVGPFWRLRYLESPAGFAGKTEKPLRYVQAISSRPHAYFPAGEPWDVIAKDPTVPLVLTEGELKAACACKFGFPTIGLGGVHNWRSLPKGIEWIDDLAQFNWRGRNAYICFDSDYATNPQVCNAMRELAVELERRGAFVKIVSMPTLSIDGKTGIDDYICNEEGGPDRFRKLLHEAVAVGLTDVLFGLNDKYSYVRSPGMVVDLAEFAKFTPEAFKGHVEATLRHQETFIRPDGTIGHKAVSGAAKWIQWPLRNQHKRITYAPGQPLSTEGGELNLWPGWGVQPVKGDARLFTDLLKHIFTGAEPGAMDWFMDWLAYPLQHPGTKLFSSAVIHGVRHGTGKTFIGYVMKKIYGKNFTEIKQGHLQANHNEWAENKQFVLGDDVTGNDRRVEADLLKTLITQKELRLNPKYIPSYVVPDVINYLFTSNQPDAVFLEDDDRRFYIHEVLVGPIGDDFYAKMDEALWRGNLASAVFDLLLKRDLRKFNPNAAAMKTLARNRMLDDARSDLAVWVRGLMADPERLLKQVPGTVPRDLWTAKELFTLYDPLGTSKATAGGLGRELKRAGVHQVYEGRPIKAPDGAQGRYYAIRNQDKWLGQEYKKFSDHLEQCIGAAMGERNAKY